MVERREREIERVGVVAATAGCVVRYNSRTCWHNARSCCACPREAARATSTACERERLLLTLTHMLLGSQISMVNAPAVGKNTPPAHLISIKAMAPNHSSDVEEKFYSYLTPTVPNPTHPAEVCVELPQTAISVWINTISAREPWLRDDPRAQRGGRLPSSGSVCALRFNLKFQKMVYFSPRPKLPSGISF